MITYQGYIICEELQTVHIFESDYATKQSVANNIERAICDYYNISACHCDAMIYSITEERSIYEEAESAALDSVSGGYGIEQGYRLVSEPIFITRKETSITYELSKAYGISRTMIERLFNAYMSASDTQDEAEERGQFSAFITRLQTVY